MDTLKNAFSWLISVNVPYPSTLGFKYPALRDHPIHSAEIWLKGKRIDDGAEGLWRIHDGLYDMTSFVSKHPGGAFWLEVTKETDITEAFEAHHISLKAEEILPKFYVRDAKTPRNSPFTFKKDGFYRNLKKNIREAMKDVPEAPSKRSKVIADSLLLGYLISSLSAAYFWSFSMGVAAGFFLNFTAIAAHNFFHQKDNFRMYYFDFCLMRSRSWRVSHAMSHHAYTNTVKDLEISSFEPFFQYLPQRKSFFFRYLSWFYSPIVYSLMFFGNWLSDTIQSVISRKFYAVQLLPFTVPLAMFFISNHSAVWISFMFWWILTTGSLMFGIVGVNAAHHHPDIFHDGDTPRATEDLDWGIHQIDCVMDRHDITGSHLLVLTNFGDHALHHLFPTIDHGKLEFLYPAFRKTCEEFGIELRMTSQLELIKGQFLQLAKVEPNGVPPKGLKVISGAD